jgi:hypothetical protein
MWKIAAAVWLLPIALVALAVFGALLAIAYADAANVCPAGNQCSDAQSTILISLTMIACATLVGLQAAEVLTVGAVRAALRLFWWMAIVTLGAVVICFVVVWRSSYLSVSDQCPYGNNCEDSMMMLEVSPPLVISGVVVATAAILTRRLFR